MRMQVDSTDITEQAYAIWFNHRSDKITVTVDGVVYKFCIMADEELGEIEAYATKADGSIMLDETGNCPIVNKYRGDVKITIEPHTAT